MPMDDDDLALVSNVARVEWLKKEEALGADKVLYEYGTGKFTTV